MANRTTKRSLPPTPSRTRTTRRGIAPMLDLDAETTQFGPPPVRDTDDDEVELTLSARPTRRDIAVPEVQSPRTRSRSQAPRGEFSIPSARGIPSDAVAGAIETSEVGPRRRRTSTQRIESVHLASATKREITVVIKDRTLTLARHDALALAQIILTTFD